MSRLSATSQLHHLLAIDGLKKDSLYDLFHKADGYFKKGKIQSSNELDGCTIANLFYEPSTRTRSSFELSAKNLGAKVLNFNVNQSATSKGESLLDTIANLAAMQCDCFVIRHSESGTAHFVSQHVAAGISVINAGDGQHAHPTQALLDMYTLYKERPNFHEQVFAICGDILHSRVARSQIQALHLLGAGEIRVIAPKTLLPSSTHALGVKVYHDMDEGLKDVDVIMMLRLQKERMESALIPCGDAYFKSYGLNEARYQLANKDALIMHPGPINRGVEIQSELAEHKNSLILKQVTNGVAIRMAIMSLLFENTRGAREARYS